MPRTKTEVIASRLAEMTGLPESFPDFLSFGELYEGPFHFAPGEQIWGSGQKEGYVWFVQAGYGFDKIDLRMGQPCLME